MNVTNYIEGYKLLFCINELKKILLYSCDNEYINVRIKELETELELLNNE